MSYRVEQVWSAFPVSPSHQSGRFMFRLVWGLNQEAVSGLSDFDTFEEAAAWASYLNGGLEPGLAKALRRHFAPVTITHVRPDPQPGQDLEVSRLDPPSESGSSTSP